MAMMHKHKMIEVPYIGIVGWLLGRMEIFILLSSLFDKPFPFFLSFFLTFILLTIFKPRHSINLDIY